MFYYTLKNMDLNLLKLLMFASKQMFYVFIIQLFAMNFLVASNSNGQRLDKVFVTIQVENATLEEVFSELEDRTGFAFGYHGGVLSDKQKLSLDYEKASLLEVLNNVSKETSLSFKRINQTISVTNKYRIAFNLLKNKVNEMMAPDIIRTVKGRVTDENAEPMPGVNVILKGTITGTTTDANGDYTLNVPDDATVLVYSFIGYKPQEAKIDDLTTINITLTLDITNLSEVVIIGYGDVERRDLTGSVSTVKGKDISDLPATINIDEALQGQAAGVLVVQETGQPGGAARVRIRGSTSLLGSNQPLYVIDGIPVEATSNIPDNGSATNRAFLQQGLNTPLGNINPNDIESISILKDASAAAIYGSRAANGVVIITTKRGSAIGKPQFAAAYGFSGQKAQTSDVLDATQFKQIWTEAVENSGSTNAFAQSILDGTYFGNANTNWEDEVSPSNPITTNYDVSVSGGNEAVKYYTSVGTRNQQGTFDNSEFERYSINLNLDTKLTERLQFGSNFNFSRSKQISPSARLLSSVYTFRPDLPVFDENGEYTVSPTNSFENPVARSKTKSENTTVLFLGSIYGKIELSKGLSFKSFLSLNYNLGDFSNFSPSFTFDGGFRRNTGPGDGFGQESTSTGISHTWENTLTYNKILQEKHDITTVLGASWQGNTNEYLQASGEGFPQDGVLTNLGSASNTFRIDSYKQSTGLASYFGRVNYAYNDKYLFTIAGRVDGSSKFAKDNTWAFFPTAAAAWRLSDETFLSSVRFIEDLKIRASYGITGQQDFGAYQWRTLFESATYGGQPGVIQNQLGNSQLQWETTQQFDIGIDHVLFGGRINGTVGYYEKNTHDLLYFVKTPGNTGTTTVIGNLGDTQNKGIEIEIAGDIIKTNKFVWNLSLNASRNKNKLVRLNDDFLEENGTINPPNTGSVLKVGEPLGLIFGRVADGIFQTQDEIDVLNTGAPDGVYQRNGTSPGDIKYRDINGPDGVPDGEVDNFDRTIIGDTQADLFGGFTSTWTYKGITLSALFTYSVGNDLRWDAQRNGVNFPNAFLSENKITDVLNRWTPENPTNQPRAVYLDPNDNDAISSFYVHDASYLRLRNINISYNLSTSLLERTRFLKSVTIYASATNLLLFTKYPGANPETNNLYNDDVSSGLDNSRFPRAKVFSGGVKIGF